MILLNALINLLSRKVTVTNITFLCIPVRLLMQSPETELVIFGLGLVVTIKLADLKIFQDEARVGDCVGYWVGELKLRLTHRI